MSTDQFPSNSPDSGVNSRPIPAAEGKLKSRAKWRAMPFEKRCELHERIVESLDSPEARHLNSLRQTDRRRAARTMAKLRAYLLAKRKVGGDTPLMS
jgi:hypothetical protein